MKKLLVYIFLFIFPILGQAQDFWCGSFGGGTAVSSVSGFTSLSSTEYEVRVYLHIVKNSTGKGVTNVEALAAYNDMVSDFAPYGICFSLAQMDSFIEDDFVDNWGDSCFGGDKINDTDDNDYEELFSYPGYSHNDGVDIYILPDDGSYAGGRADGIPGTAFLVGGKFLGENNTPFRSLDVLTHEMGHSLGLSHTFRGLALGEDKNQLTCGFIFCDVCPELVDPMNMNITNRENCGDFVTDTPADPFFNPFNPPLGVSLNLSTCTWSNTTEEDANNDLYNPDATNYMGFSRDVCTNSFSPGQVTRMKSFLADPDILGPVVISTNTCSAPVQRMVASTDYKPLFRNSEWLVASTFIFEGYIPERIYQIEDTVINNVTYHRVLREVVEVDGLINAPFVTGGSKLEVYREDIEARKIWFVFNDYQDEILAFDFSLSVGDLMPEDTTKVLQNIDMIQLKGVDHRRFTFVDKANETSQFVWLEGIGNLLDPLRSRGQFFAPEGYAGLLCASQNGELLYNERAVAINLPDPCSNYITVPTQNIPLLDPSLSLFPNPGDTYITLKSDVLVGEIVSWSIRDVLGRAIITEAQTRLSANFQIDIEQLDAGTYFLTLANKNGQQTLRFVKQ